MDVHRQAQFYNALVRRAMRREHIFRPRSDPFEEYDDLDFHIRYRFRKETVQHLIDMLEGDFDLSYGRPTDLTVAQQIFMTLRFYATGSFQRVIGDLAGISQSAACTAIHRISQAFCPPQG